MTGGSATALPPRAENHLATMALNVMGLSGFSTDQIRTSTRKLTTRQRLSRSPSLYLANMRPEKIGKNGAFLRNPSSRAADAIVKIGLSRAFLYPYPCKIPP